MEISILLAIFLIAILLGRAFLQWSKVCPILREQIDDSVTIKYDLMNRLSHRAVKFVMRAFYLLNIVVLIATQKATQNTLIQTQNLKFEG